MIASNGARIGLASSMCAVALVGGIGAGAPASAHPAPRPAKVAVSEQLTQTSVAPHSRVAYALGTKYKSPTSTTFVDKRSGSHWKKLAVKLPKGDPNVSSLAAGSPSSAWLVGGNYSNGKFRTLVEHSTGGAFKPVKTSLGSASLQDVAASSKSNVWVAGTTSTSTPLIAHGNGHKWTKLKVPAKLLPLSIGGPLSLSTLSPKDTWLLAATSTTPVLLHWNGHSLSSTTIKKIPSGGVIRTISATSAKSVWMVGTFTKQVGSSYRIQSFAEHLSGNSFKTYKLSSGRQVTYAVQIAAVGSRAYVAGEGGLASGTHGVDQHAFAETFRGGKWHRNKVAQRGKTSEFSSVSASSKVVVAVGASYNGNLCDPKHLNVVASPYAASLTSTSSHGEITPKLRSAGRFPLLRTC